MFLVTTSFWGRPKILAEVDQLVVFVILDEVCWSGQLLWWNSVQTLHASELAIVSIETKFTVWSTLNTQTISHTAAFNHFHIPFGYLPLGPFFLRKVDLCIYQFLLKSLLASEWFNILVSYLKMFDNIELFLLETLSKWFGSPICLVFFTLCAVVANYVHAFVQARCFGGCWAHFCYFLLEIEFSWS